MTDDVGEDGESGGRDFATEARSMGWQPKEEFKGDPARFIDAQEYVERGEQLLPIVRAENKHLRQELNQLQGKLSQTDSLLKAAQEAIDGLKEANTQIALEKAKDQRKQLAGALAEARRDGDTEKELEIQDQLDATSDAIKKAAEKPVAKQTTVVSEPALDPATKQFMTDNPWFGSDKKRTALAMAAAQELREAGTMLVGAAFYNKVKEEVDKVLPFDTGSTRRTSKVEGGGTGGDGVTGGSPRGQSFGDLPAEAKAACERQALRVVGKGRAFADIAAWRKHYAKSYFAS